MCRNSWEVSLKRRSLCYFKYKCFFFVFIFEESSISYIYLVEKRMTYPFQMLVSGHRPSINLSQGNTLWSEWGDTDQYWQGTCQWKTNTRGQCSLNYRGVTYCWTNIRSRCESYNSQQRKVSYSYHVWFLWLSFYLVDTVSQGCTEMALVSRVTEQELQMLFLCHLCLAVMSLLRCSTLLPANPAI